MAGRVDWQKPKKLANVFTTGFDFSSISASSFDLNSFSSVKNNFISMEFTMNPRYSACCLGVKTDFFRFPRKPKSVNNCHVSCVCYRHSSGVAAMISMLSKYTSSQTPRALR